VRMPVAEGSRLGSDFSALRRRSPSRADAVRSRSRGLVRGAPPACGALNFHAQPACGARLIRQLCIETEARAVAGLHHVALVQVSGAASGPRCEQVLFVCLRPCFFLFQNSRSSLPVGNKDG